MKKFTAILLVALSLFLLASCGSRNGENSLESLIFNTIETESETQIETVPPETEPPEPETVKATFVGCGDNIVYTGTLWEAQAQAYTGTRAYNFKPIYEPVADIIRDADISYINQECVMDGGEPAYYPMFNSPQELGYDLVELGFDVVNIANNHMLDRGGAGLKSTIEFWKSLDTVMIGGNLDHDDYDSVEIIERNGIRVALLSYCEMTNGLTIGADYDVWIPYLDREDIKRQCDSVKDKCDLILCSVHWGEEYVFTPTEEEKTWAKYMADCGVDVIIGTHPHVIQPIEWIEGEGGNKTLCVYSLGNFMAMQAFDYNMLGGIISFDINKKGDERAYVDNVVFIPTVYYFAQNWYGSRVYKLSDFTEEMAASHGLINYGRTLKRSNLEYYLHDTIADEFLPEEFIS